jgi:hypothetical protein
VSDRSHFILCWLKAVYYEHLWCLGHHHLCAASGVVQKCSNERDFTLRGGVSSLLVEVVSVCQEPSARQVMAARLLFEVTMNLQHSLNPHKRSLGDKCVGVAKITEGRSSHLSAGAGELVDNQNHVVWLC